MNCVNKIVLFLDIDGVLNQYRHCERVRRCHLKKIGWSKCFDPYPKKVIRLSRLVKKYNIDVFVFSAWTKSSLEKFLPFNLVGDTRKNISNLNYIAKSYERSILIEDEVRGYLNRGYTFEVDKVIIPQCDFGLVLKDFKILERYLKESFI